MFRIKVNIISDHMKTALAAENKTHHQMRISHSMQFRWIALIMHYSNFCSMFKNPHNMQIPKI